jgi:serine/threonine protein phosphatase PrpC
LEENDKEDEHLEEGIMNNNEAMAKEDDNDEEEQLEMATAAVMASIKTI